MVCVTSGKGGVGKTTTSASLAMGLAERGFRVCAVDFDIGLRNLDLHLGCERRIVFDFVNVIQSECKLHQALIKDRHQPNLFMLAASQTRDKTALTAEGVEQVIEQLRSSFDYIICDSPAGIERGAQLAMYFADEAVVVTNPEVSSVRDSDRVLGLLGSKTKRAESADAEPVQARVLVTRLDQGRIDRGEMMTVDDVLEILAAPLLGIIPESQAVLRASNVGLPVILDEPSAAARAYEDAVARLTGADVEMRVEGERRPGLFSRLFGRAT